MAATLIVGATGKIGRIVTAALLERGETVIATGSRAASVAALEAGFSEAVGGGRLHTSIVDLTAHDAIETLLAWLQSRGLQPDSLVFSARDLRFLTLDRDGLVDSDDFLSEITLAVVAPYRLTLALARMPGTRLANVVNVSSMYGVVAPTPALYEGDLSRLPVSYGVAKAAMLHLTKELAVRLAPGIRVNAVSFGGIEGRADEGFRARYATLCPTGRMLREDEVVAPILFLLDSASSSVVGANLVADGGWTLS